MNTQIRRGLFLACMQLGVGLLAVVGGMLGLIDGDIAVRMTMVGIGLMLLVTANAASKAVARSARVIANQRLLAWSMTLGALVWIGIWLFAPMGIAGFAAPAVVFLGFLAPLAYCILTRSKTPI